MKDDRQTQIPEKKEVKHLTHAKCFQTKLRTEISQRRNYVIRMATKIIFLLEGLGRKAVR